MEEIINIGSRRELFWDDTILDMNETGTVFTMHHPVRRECVITLDGPDGQDESLYNSVVYDNGVYRLYMPACGLCCFESTDGKHWEAPDYGISEKRPTKNGGRNCLMTDSDPSSPWYNVGGFDGFKPIIDTNPNCLPEERYKSVANRTEHNLTLYTSPDGIHWTRKGDFDFHASFDSQNTMLYDEITKKYQVFFRDFHSSPLPEEQGWYRDIRYTESEDLIHWKPRKLLRYDDYVDWQLYTNCINKYYRAPHVYIGFPARYIQRKEWTDNYDELCGLEKRKTRSGRHATALTDALFMTSRDGINWKRYNDAYMTPGPEHPTNWVYGNCYIASGLVETASDHPGCDNEISMYVWENRFSKKPCQVYRYTTRLDGFVSMFAPWHGTQLVTKPFIFEGKELYINFATSAYGHMRLTLRALDDSAAISTGEIFGDSTNRHVRFLGGKTPADLAGKPVVMSIQMRDAHMYSFKFED